MKHEWSLQAILKKQGSGLLLGTLICHKELEVSSGRFSLGSCCLIYENKSSVRYLNGALDAAFSNPPVPGFRYHSTATGPDSPPTIPQELRADLRS